MVRFEIKKFEQGLPAYRMKQKFHDEILFNKNPFCLIIGETGCGKSTQLP
jgi:HrpA-like RNA helicase